MAQEVVTQLLLHHTSLQAYLLLFPLILLLVVLYLAATAATRSSNKQLNQLPSPPKLPLVGHLHLVGALPHVSLCNLAKKHGPDLMLLLLGAVPNLVVSSPRAAEEVLRRQDQVFASRPRSMVASILSCGWANISFSPYGEHWRQARKLVTTHLLSVKKVQSYRLGREEEMRLVVAKIREAAAAGAAANMSELLNAFSNDVVCRAVSGKFFRKEGRNKLFRELLVASGVLLGGFKLEDYFPSLTRVGVLSKVMCTEAERLKKGWQELIDKLIDEHANNSLSLRREDGARGGEEEEGRSFIDVLLAHHEEYGLTRGHVKSILMDMLGAGIDTSYLVLEFTMAELIRNPRVMAKLQAEVRRITPKGQEMVTEDDLSGMTYLKAVIKETLRLHPPAALLLPHLSIEECDIDGYTIPSGAHVIVNAWALGRDARFWEAAEEFVPERFTDGGSAAMVDFKGQDFQYLPFGAGRRMCPGMNFGMASIEIMLANLAYHFDWELPAWLEDRGVDMTEVFGLTVRMKEELFLVPKEYDVKH